MKTKLKTITLEGIPGNPSWVLCPGHVTQKVFNDAFKNEGWSQRGDYKQKDLRYEYWVKIPLKKNGYAFQMKRSLPGKSGAKPYTVTHWD